jgi:hypothetical protein
VPKVAQIGEISGNFWCFLPGNKDSDPCLEDPDFFSPAKKGQRVGSLNPNPWIRNNTNCIPLLRIPEFRDRDFQIFKPNQN